MSRKMLCLGILCSIYLMGAATAQAVTIDLSSPQEGEVLGPGDTVELTMVVTNDTDKKDIVFVWLSMVIETEERTIVLGRARPLRLKMDAGDEVTKTIAATIPEFLPELPFGLLDVTIEATADGKRSKTTDTDSTYFTLDL